MTTEKTILIKFIQQLLSEGQSIHNIKKEYGLPYDLVDEVAHGTKYSGSTQYQKNHRSPIKTKSRSKC